MHQQICTANLSCFTKLFSNLFLIDMLLLQFKYPKSYILAL